MHTGAASFFGLISTFRHKPTPATNYTGKPFFRQQSRIRFCPTFAAKPQCPASKATSIPRYSYVDGPTAL